MESSQEESNKKYINYGMPRLGASSILTLIDMGLLSLYTTGYGVDPLLAGFALGMGKLAIAASQFLLGWLSDTTKTRLGKRKPYMITFAPVLGIFFILLCLPTVFVQTPSMMDLFWWLLIFDFALQFVYGGLTTPYQSWMAEKFEVQERPKASAYQNLFGMLGVAVAVIIVFLVLPSATSSYSTTGLLTIDFIAVIVVIGIMVIVLFYLCTILLSTEEQKETKVDFMGDVKFILRDRNFMKVCLLQGIAFLAWGMVTPTLIDFVTIVLGFDSYTLYAAAAILFLGIMAFLFTWLRLIDKKGKKYTIGIIFLLAVIVLPFSLIGLLPNIPFAVAIIYVIGVAACLAGWYLFPYIWYADLAEDAKKRGDLDDMKAGLYAGFPNVLLNIFQAIALIITGGILSLPNVPGQTYSLGYVIWGVWCSGVLLIGYIYIKKFIVLDFDWEKEQRT
jgi:GPH family glycoside/pentoside/hexuronide:cation symporter